ncbi:MAG: MBL fold metallo-hydrolase [Candidatus Azambacteria bacterium]|nr:MBL fold metallo-hydrolase [Candidatus Azambacteria bacterium]
MTISWYGEACFLLENSGVRILIEPPQKESGINPPRLKSDILIFSRPRADIAGALSQPSDATFVIDSPGEYEVGGVRVLGVADGENNLYNIEIDGVKISHLGFLKNDLDDEKIAIFDDSDIILVPVGNNEVLDAEAAMKLINKLEPSIAIPMLYDVSAKGGSAPGGKEPRIKRAPITAFLKESEAKEPPQPKLTIKKKDINEEEIKIVILEKV